MALITLLVVLAVVAAAHLAAMAAVASLLGVAVREVVLGWGPVVLSFAAWRLKALPFGGVVHLRDTRNEYLAEDAESHETADAFNLKPRWVQAIVPLSGPAALLLIAFVVRGSDAFPSFGAAFGQWVGGAIDHDRGHALLGRLPQAIQLGFWPLLGIMAAKMAALNLLPLPFLNGGQAILGFAIGPTREHPRWLQRVQVGSVWVAIVFLLLWLGAATL